MSINQLLDWVRAEMSAAGFDLLAAERTKDDVRWAVAWRKTECLREIEAILNRELEAHRVGL